MKKKLLIAILTIVMLACVFALVVSATENYDYEYTLQDKTTLYYYGQFNYTNGDSQVTVNTESKDQITITFLDEQGNILTKVPMWEYDEADGKYYGLVWYIADYELTLTEADQYTWAQANGTWGNQYDTEGDKREKCTSAVYTLKKVRAVDLTCEYTTDTKTYSYTNTNHANCTWTWARNGQSFNALKTIYLDAEKTTKLQAPVGIGQSSKNQGYESYVDQIEGTGNKIVAANLKDLDFQTHYTDYSSKSLWTLATNLQCLWYPDTVVHLASNVGANIREVEFEGLEVIGCQMFRGNMYITEFRVPSKCEYLCDEVFRESAIKTIRYGEGIKVVANAALAGITPAPTTYYLSTNFISDSYLTGFTNTTWGYGYIINSTKATVYFAGTKSEAEALWTKISADNSSYTEVYYYDYNEVTERKTTTGMAIFYNYNKCDALYKGEHNKGEVEAKFEGEEYVSNFVHASTCQRCQLNFVIDTICGPLFTDLGYSKADDGTAFTYDIKLNKTNIDAYEQATGKELIYGFIVGSYTEGDAGDIINANGEATTEKSVVTDFADVKYAKLDKYCLKMTGISESQHEMLIYCNAYVSNGEAVSYMGAVNEDKKALAISYKALPTKDEE